MRKSTGKWEYSCMDHWCCDLMMCLEGRSYTCYYIIIIIMFPHHCLFDGTFWIQFYTWYLIILKCLPSFICKTNQSTWCWCVCRAIRLGAGQGAHSRCPPFSMSAQRTLVFMGLLLLILNAGYCKQRDRDDTSLLDLLIDRARLTREHRSDGHIHSPKISEDSVETKDVNKVKTDQNERILGKDHSFDWLTKQHLINESMQDCGVM